MTDNFLDISHFPYVHVGTFGIESNTLVPKIELEQLDDDFYGYDYTVEVGNEAGAVSSGIDADVVTRRMTTGFNLPFTVRSTIHYETGLDHLILLCSTPVDDVTSLLHVRRSGATTTTPCRPRRSSPSTGRSAPRTSCMLERVPGVLPLDPHAHGERAVRPSIGGVAPPARRPPPPLTDPSVPASGVCRRASPAADAP